MRKLMSNNRVVRGGSWLYDQGGARADYRYGYHPHHSDVYYGFRVLQENSR